MAAYEGPGQTDIADESLTDDYTSDEEIDNQNESKSFYMTPLSFVIHTYSRVQPYSVGISTQLSQPYRHKVTMFKVFCVILFKTGKFAYLQY